MSKVFRKLTEVSSKLSKVFGFLSEVLLELSEPQNQKSERPMRVVRTATYFDRTSLQTKHQLSEGTKEVSEPFFHYTKRGIFKKALPFSRALPPSSLPKKILLTTIQSQDSQNSHIPISIQKHNPIQKTDTPKSGCRFIKDLFRSKITLG